MYFERWGSLAPPLEVLVHRLSTMKAFLKDMLCRLWSATVFAFIEQECTCTRAAFGRAGVQETVMVLRQAKERGGEQRAWLREEKNEPRVLVGEMIRPDLGFGWFGEDILVLDRFRIPAILESLFKKGEDSVERAWQREEQEASRAPFLGALPDVCIWI